MKTFCIPRFKQFLVLFITFCAALSTAIAQNEFNINNSNLTNNMTKTKIPANVSFLETNDYSRAFLKSFENIISNTGLKNQELSKTSNLVRIKIQANGYVDSTIVYFNENATEEFDSDYDVYCYPPPSGDVPNLYSITPLGTALFINALPNDLMTDYIQDLGLELYTQGSYTISVDEINQLDFIHIYLLDLGENKITNLRVNNSYQFNFTGGVENDRFKLIFELNKAPILYNEIDDQFTDEDIEYNFILPNNLFVELDHKDILSYSIKSADEELLPDWLNFNPVTKTISGIPENDDVGIIPIRILAYDIFSDSAYCDYILEVINVNDQPIIYKEIEDQEISVGESFVFELPDSCFIDIDPNDTLSYTTSDLPDWLDFNSEDLIFSGTPGNNDISEYIISVQAQDLEGSIISDDFSLKVTGSTELPNISVNDIRIGPNPTKDFIIVYLDGIKNCKNSNLEIYNSYGMKVQVLSLETEEFTVDLSEFSAGLYYLKFIIDEAVITKVVLKR